MEAGPWRIRGWEAGSNRNGQLQRFWVLRLQRMGRVRSYPPTHFTWKSVAFKRQSREAEAAQVCPLRRLGAKLCNPMALKLQRESESPGRPVEIRLPSEPHSQNF